MRIPALVGAIALAALATTAAFAHQVKVGTLIIHHPWTRATPKGATVAGGYTIIENTGDKADRLIGGTFAESAAVELHVMEMKDGVMTMRPAKDGIPIPPHGRIEFQPGGLHMMFTGLKSQLMADDEIAGTLVFEKAGSVAVDYEVQGMGTKEPVESPGHDHGATN